ncbi:MAG: hypothetical protein JWN78_2331 [Bacteroidota bacterium]|nr:hypothetical protein [Bacteroidota bacterium]
MRFLQFLFLLISIPVFAENYFKVIYVADHKVDCGNSKKCFLTRDSPTEQWETFESSIEGFNFVEGYEYCILVEIQSPLLSNSIADSIHPKYILNDIKSKIKTGNTSRIIKNIPDSSKWILYKLKTKDGTKTFSIPKAYLQFHTKNNTINGNTECNDLNATFKLDSSQLKFEDISTTKMACKKHSIEPAFLKMMNEATNYKVASNLLYIYKSKYLLAMFTRKK